MLALASRAPVEVLPIGRGEVHVLDRWSHHSRSDRCDPRRAATGAVTPTPKIESLLRHVSPLVAGGPTMAQKYFSRSLEPYLGFGEFFVLESQSELEARCRSVEFAGYVY